MALLAPCLPVALAVLAGPADQPSDPRTSISPSLFSTAQVAASVAPPYAEGEVLVKFRAGTRESERGALRSEMGAASRWRFRSGAEHWRLPPGLSTEEAMRRFRGHPLVDYIEPNYIVAADRLPDDPSYAEQHGLRNTGAGGALAGADIDAGRAWNLSIGSRDVVVAVIDSGVNTAHPDLAQNIFVNPGETPHNGVDDDGNGFIDDTGGWDFKNNDAFPLDDAGHGTHVAGIVGAVGDNGRGVAGVCWRVSLLPVKFLDANGTGFSADAIRAIDYAALMGARIMSNSWGGGGFSLAMEEAIDAAGAAGVLFVAAAGNQGSNLDLQPHYPASYALPNVVAVAATDARDELAAFSNYGGSSVLLGAPGVGILSTFPNGYGLLSGTSMAAPMVSGAVALLLARDPGMSVEEILRRLRDGADLVPGLAAKTVAGGRLNAFRMMAEEDTTPPGTIEDLAVEGRSSSTVTLHWTATGDDGAAGRASTYEVRLARGASDPAASLSGTVFVNRLVPGPAGAGETLEVTGLEPAAAYSFVVRALDEWEQPGPFSNVAAAATLGAPSLAASPEAIEAALRTGQSAAATLLVENTGAGTLDWRIDGAGGAAGGGAAPPEGSSKLPAWLAIPLPAGRVAAGGRQEIPLTLDAAGLPGGLYEGTVVLLTNDPQRPRAEIPVRMAVTDAPAIEVLPARLDFGSVFAGSSSALPVTVLNRGTVNLVVSGVTAEDAALAVDPEGFLLAPGGARVFQVTYAPALPSELRAAVVILSDAANEPMAPVAVTGTALLPPAVDVTPGALETALPSGGRAAAHVLLANGGGSDLLAAIGADSGAGPPWLLASPANVAVPPGGAIDVTVRFDATGLQAATYQGTVRIASNVPGRPSLEVPVRLTVEAAPHLEIQAPDVLLESRLEFTHVGDSTHHVLASPIRPAAGGTVEIQVDGDFDNPPEKATLVVEGEALGAAGGAAGECGSVTRSFEVGPGSLAALLADGILEVEVRNTAAVEPECGANRHTVRLRYAAAADRIDFGDIRAGAAQTRSVLLRNTGSLDLHVTSIAALLPGATVSETAMSIPPGTTVALGLRLAAGPSASSAEQVLEGSLLIDSDDPTAARRTVGLSANVLPPTRFEIVPDRVEAALLEGKSAVRALTLSNPGSSPIDLALSVGDGTTTAAPGPCPPASLLVAGFNTGTLEIMDVNGGARRTVATGFFGPSALAVDPAGRLAYVAEFNGRLAVVDLLTGEVTRFPAGIGIAFGMALDTVARTLYVSSYTSGSIFRIDPATGVKARVASGLLGPRAIAIDGVGSTAWVIEGTNGMLSQVDLATGGITVVATGLSGATGLAIDHRGDRAYVGLGARGSLMEVDLATGAMVELFTGLAEPSHLALDDSGTALFAAEFGGDRVSVLDLRTRTLRAVVEGSREPSGLALSSPSACLAGFASVEPRVVSIPAGGTVDVALHVDSMGFPEGEFGALLSIGPLRPLLSLAAAPLDLTVVPRPWLVLAGQEAILESSRSYTTSGALTRHALAATMRPGTAGTLEVILEGDYAAFHEKGTVSLEGRVLGDIGGAGARCIPVSGRFEVDAAVLADAAADGVVEIQVQNSNTVGANCAINRHGVRLAYRNADPASGVDFGVIDLGQEQVIPLLAQNRGSRTLEVAGIDASGPGFTASPGEVSLPRGASGTVAVRFAGLAAGVAEGRLRLSSNDPDMPSAEVALRGLAVFPPSLEWAPPALEADVLEGGQVSRTLMLSNRGGRALTLQMSARPPGEATVTPASASLPPDGTLAATVRFVADRVPLGTRSIEIVIASNDPARPEIRVPASFLVMADADRDGITDASDLCPSAYDPGQFDRDQDRAGDECDNCLDVPNAGQEDADGDGSGDACQPILVFAGVRQDGGQRLEVAVRAVDPQREPLQGTIDVLPDEAGLPGLTREWTGALPRLSDISALARGRRYRLVLTVTDGSTQPVSLEAEFLHQEETILVLDMPPRSIPVLPPVVECDRPLAGAVRLDGSGSMDEDSTPGTSDDIVSYEWLLLDGEGTGRSIGSGPVLGADLPFGENRVVLRVIDAAGESAEEEARVVVTDTTPPALSLAALPAVLWPPDHRLVPVRLVWQAADACDPAPAIDNAQATSSEPDDAPGAGDGRTTGDVGPTTVGAAEGLVTLRAERDASGPGRVYTLTCEARDRSGNAASATTTANVPRTIVGGP